MHRDAQLAMVRIAIGRMDVRYLNDGKERQQGQAHESHGPETSWLLEASPTEMCPQAAQSTIPDFQPSLNSRIQSIGRNGKGHGCAVCPISCQIAPAKPEQVRFEQNQGCGSMIRFIEGRRSLLVAPT
jgi:hypothetical protein